MKSLPIVVLAAAVICTLLIAGCTTPAPVTQTPVPTTPVATPATTAPTAVATTRQPLPDITGSWTLVSGVAGMGATNALPGTTVTATFSSDGRLTGSAGCNNYAAAYTTGLPNVLSIANPVATTQKTCNSPAGIMTQETLYLTSLKGAASYAINGDLLTVSDSNGNSILTYRKSAGTPLPLAGTPWVLETYTKISGSTVGVLPSTKVTILFGPGGNLSGSAGCNSYSGGYSLTGQNSITIGPLITTLMYCGEPGVMDQETSYLALLNTAASYDITPDGTLNLRNATGTPVLVYSGS